MNLKSLFSITFVTFGCSSFAKAVVLAVDFKDSDVPIPAQVGFSPFVLSGGASQVIGDYTVTIDATAGSAVPTTGSITGFDGTSSDFDDRLRSTPLNSGFLTMSDLYRDFIFSPDSNNGGLNVTIDGLEPNTEYLFEIWSYDPVSVGGTIDGVPNFRVSDWFAGGFQVIENYSFRGENAPTNDLASFTFTATADIDGLLRAPRSVIDQQRFSAAWSFLERSSRFLHSRAEQRHTSSNSDHAASSSPPPLKFQKNPAASLQTGFFFLSI
jgi:hypothetical protein